MTDLLKPYSIDEVNAVLRILTQLVVLIFATSVGTFTRELLFPKENSFQQNVGFTLVASFIAFAINLKFTDRLTLAYTFLMCITIGFFLPGFKDWLRGRKLAKIASRILKNTSDLTTTIIDEVNEELEKVED